LTYIEITASHPSSGELTYIFEQKEETKLRQYKFSVYAFEARDFRRIPSGEFLAEKSVRPIEETAHDGGLRAILDSGFSVVFVADMERCYETLKRHGFASTFGGTSWGRSETPWRWNVPLPHQQGCDRG
jgi:hypothetical protein